MPRSASAVGYSSWPLWDGRKPVPRVQRARGRAPAQRGIFRTACIGPTTMSDSPGADATRLAIGGHDAILLRSASILLRRRSAHQDHGLGFEPRRGVATVAQGASPGFAFRDSSSPNGATQSVPPFQGWAFGAFIGPRADALGYRCDAPLGLKPRVRRSGDPGLRSATPSAYGNDSGAYQT